MPLSDLRILVHDQERSELRRYAKVDLLDGGNGLMIYDYESRTKLSLHEDGTVYERTAGAGEHTAPGTTIPFSKIQQQTVRQVSIPPDSLTRLPVYTGNPEGHLVFSSTVFPSNGTFAAEIVDDSRVAETRAAWETRPDYVSAQTWRPTGTGKTVFLTILNQRSE